MINAEQLVTEAIDQAGLDDFGGEAFHEPLALLESCLNSQAGLNGAGVFRAEMAIRNALATRLQVEDYIRKHPDLLQQPVERPVFIAGLPRTGTTALHHMLNADPTNHTLRLWEGNEPVPPPEDASYTTDPRIERQRKGVETTEQFMPGFLASHLLAAEAPDECHLLFNRTLMSAEFYSMFHIPGYANSIYQLDLTPYYEYHRRQLQLLQTKKSGSWVLKSPFHQIGLEAIHKVYPDAIIVVPHRAPMSFVASGCSFNDILRKSGSDARDKHIVGRDWMDMLTVYTRRFEQDRARLESQFETPFIDVRHDEFIRDPWPAIEQIYHDRGTPLSSEGRAAMQGWLDDNPKGKHGVHEYKLEDYGITRAEVEDLFGDYVERYGLSME
ncbi:MAG: sulfotransferase [Gammaproteobacteria bacterium]|nr:sulfotransferase [Gammaproteobacteria bacterium]